MTPNLRSRLSGRTITAVPAGIVQDLFDTQEPGADSATRVVPGGLRADLDASFLGRPPEPLETNAIRQVVEPLGERAPWSRWKDAIPLVPRIDKRVRLQPLDKKALAQLPHLQHVCHHPRLLLRIEEERLPVARARRIPIRAAASLVAHPGDWEHRTIRSIQPTRVLAVRVEDEWNLYENRMAARLVDHLLAWTGSRVDELQRLQKLADDGRGFDDEARGSRFRGARLYELWGKFFVDDALTRELARTLEALERLQRALQALLDSALYRAIPRRAFVPVALVPTNILVNDPHYRKVAALWRAWVRHGHAPGSTREDLRLQRQADCRCFDAFALLVVVQALHGLGYEAGPEAVLPGGPVELRGRLGQATLAATGGVLRLEIQGEALRLTSVLAPVDREDATATWEQIRSGADRPGDTVVLLHGHPEDIERLDPRTAMALGGWERPRVLPISPWSLDSVERVARVIRAWEAPRRFSAYPPRTRVQPDPGIALPAWMRRFDASVAVVAAASANERRAFTSACDLREAQLLREQQAAQRKQGRFDPGLLKSIHALRDLAEKAHLLEPWTVCPVCDHPVGNDFKPRPGGDDRWERWSWWCRCTQCSSQWGLQVCSSCCRAFPVLAPNVRWSSTEQDEPPAGWIDRAFGRDLWAEPCSIPGARDVFRCSSCGACPEGRCVRCA